MGNCLRKVVDTEERKIVTMILEKIKTIEIKVIDPEPVKTFEFMVDPVPLVEKPEN